MIDSGTTKRLITSDSAGDGKSTISKKLAKENAALNKRTLLIDFDIRESNRIGIGPGIVEYMSEGTSLESCIVCEDSYFVFLPGLRKRNKFKQYFNKEKFEELLKKMEDEYDVIIVDTPPFGFIGDAKYVIPYCDQVVLVNRGNDLSNLKKMMSQYDVPVYIVDNYH